MSDITTHSDDATSDIQVDELTVLKQRAKLMGVPISNNIGLETLRERIRAKMEAIDKIENPTVAIPEIGETIAGTKPLSIREQLQRDEMKLVRLRITNLDPNKKDLHGEIFTLANEYLGTVAKYIPFGEVTDNGYHVPYCIYRQLESRKFLNIRTKKASNGQTKVEQGWVKEFALEVLPPLTQNELAKLANAQAAAGVLNPDT
jgi:hypothetical protein